MGCRNRNSRGVGEQQEGQGNRGEGQGLFHRPNNLRIEKWIKNGVRNK